ncbi:uncharacterized protein LOC110727015 [Chenopodium quinoa]|uniref:uncharacterized protein LOC110727015 n=1 Tax=Chenopodium quinoa TaxID=63459 RepID=UPI000B774B2F|nr:uncharacterized protein LOC110727015 [Chenopodium quinoa]
MADELADNYANLTLNSEETDVVDVGDIDHPEQDSRVSLTLVGKLYTDRGINFDAFKRTMNHAWALKGKVIIRKLESNLFAFQFSNSRDMEKVMAGRPWCFEQALLLLNSINGNEQPSEVQLTHSPFWVRLENLPFNSRSENHVKTIASNIRDVLEIEDDDSIICKSRRVRVLLDVRKPLR